MRRLYNAVCFLLESAANYVNVQAANAKQPDPEPQPEGSFTDHERGEDLLPHELHAANMHDSIDNDYGAQIGFRSRV